MILSVKDIEKVTNTIFTANNCEVYVPARDEIVKVVTKIMALSNECCSIDDMRNILYKSENLLLIKNDIYIKKTYFDFLISADKKYKVDLDKQDVIGASSDSYEIDMKYYNYSLSIGVCMKEHLEPEVVFNINTINDLGKKFQ